MLCYSALILKYACISMSTICIRYSISNPNGEFFFILLVSTIISICIRPCFIFLIYFTNNFMFCCTRFLRKSNFRCLGFFAADCSVFICYIFTTDLLQATTNYRCCRFFRNTLSTNFILLIDLTTRPSGIE